MYFLLLLNLHFPLHNGKYIILAEAEADRIVTLRTRRPELNYLVEIPIPR
jgi:hypothetical protein